MSLLIALIPSLQSWYQKDWKIIGLKSDMQLHTQFDHSMKLQRTICNLEINLIKYLFQEFA